MATEVVPPYENPALTVDAVWIRRGRILLVRRGRAPFRGCWALPGGFVELRETVEQAVIRELREETGLTAVPGALVGVYSGPKRDPRKPTASVVFRMKGVVRRLRAGDDAAEVCWIPLEDVGRLAFDHNKMVQDALAQVAAEHRGRGRRMGRHRGRGNEGPRRRPRRSRR